MKVTDRESSRSSESWSRRFNLLNDKTVDALRERTSE